MHPIGSDGVSCPAVCCPWATHRNHGDRPKEDIPAFPYGLPAVARQKPTLVADGTSCQHQLRDGAGRAALHITRAGDGYRSDALLRALEMPAKNASINSVAQRIVTL
jgi:hypothetical protein